jgi:hypothetical protein
MLRANNSERPPAVHDGASLVQLDVVDSKLLTAFHSSDYSLLFTVDHLFKHFVEITSCPLMMSDKI